jgi:hypothetical protein
MTLETGRHPVERECDSNPENPTVLLHIEERWTILESEPRKPVLFRVRPRQRQILRTKQTPQHPSQYQTVRSASSLKQPGKRRPNTCRKSTRGTGELRGRVAEVIPSIFTTASYMRLYYQIVHKAIASARRRTMRNAIWERYEQPLAANYSRILPLLFAGKRRRLSDK